jgi:hypothetical protein
MVSYLNGNYDLCIDLIEDFSLFSLINQPNKVLKNFFKKLKIFLIFQEGDTVFLKSVKEGNTRLAKFFITRPGIDIDYKDRVRRFLTNKELGLIY